VAHRFTPEQIVESLSKNRVFLRRDFADQPWMESLSAMLDELSALASAAPNHDVSRLLDLEQRIAALAGEYDFKIPSPICVMIDSLKPEAAEKP